MIFCGLPGAGGWHGGPGPVCDGLYLSAANSRRFRHEVLWGVRAALRLGGPRVVRCVAGVLWAEVVSKLSEEKSQIWGVALLRYY